MPQNPILPPPLLAIRCGEAHKRYSRDQALSFARHLPAAGQSAFAPSRSGNHAKNIRECGPVGFTAPSVAVMLHFVQPAESGGWAVD